MADSAPASMCSYWSRSFKIWIAVSLAVNILRTILAVSGLMNTTGAPLLVSISDSMMSSPAWTIFSGDLITQKEKHMVVSWLSKRQL